jgi:hypothetical protein
MAKSPTWAVLFARACDEVRSGGADMNIQFVFMLASTSRQVKMGWFPMSAPGKRGRQDSASRGSFNDFVPEAVERSARAKNHECLTEETLICYILNPRSLPRVRLHKLRWESFNSGAPFEPSARTCPGILVNTLLGGSAIFGAALPAVRTDIANFMGDRNAAWLLVRPTGNDFLPSTSDRKPF